MDEQAQVKKPSVPFGIKLVAVLAILFVLYFGVYIFIASFSDSGADCFIDDGSGAQGFCFIAFILFIGVSLPVSIFAVISSIFLWKGTKFGRISFIAILFLWLIIDLGLILVGDVGRLLAEDFSGNFIRLARPIFCLGAATYILFNKSSREFFGKTKLFFS